MFAYAIIGIMKKAAGDTAKEYYTGNDNLDITREAALYLDFYGALLTAKQVEIFDAYYNEDYSLSEIAAGLGISKQAAHDALRGAARALLEYDEKLGLIRAFHEKNKQADEAGAALDQLETALARVRAAAGAVSAATPGLSNELDALGEIACKLKSLLTEQTEGD